MSGIKILLVIIMVLVAGMAVTGYVAATPSVSFSEADDDVFDDWGVCRTRGFGTDGFYQLSETGFRPVIAFESLGEGVDFAYTLGEQFAGTYPDPIKRAEAIFKFVRDRVNYMPDIDQFKYDEFAQNADELALIIAHKGVAYGDCEDSAVLLAIIYRGAGYRSALMVGEGHTAALVYLPEYDKATVVFEIEGEQGWIWAEATAKDNPLGWVPKQFVGVGLAAYEVSGEAVTISKPAGAPSVAVTREASGGSYQPLTFIGIVVLLLIMPLFRRRRVS